MNIRSREAVLATVTPKKRSKFQKDWAGHSEAVAVWQNNFTHVEQLFSYGSAVRKVMYTTNAIESVNASFRKVTKKGAERGGCVQAAVFTDAGALPEMGGAQDTKLGARSQPTVDG